jgi:hypothetical protein
MSRIDLWSSSSTFVMAVSRTGSSSAITRPYKSAHHVSSARAAVRTLRETPARKEKLP